MCNCLSLPADRKVVFIKSSHPFIQALITSSQLRSSVKFWELNMQKIVIVGLKLNACVNKKQVFFIVLIAQRKMLLFKLMLCAGLNQ